MSQQKLLQTTNSCFTPQIRCRFLRSRPPRRRPRFLPVGALVSSRRFAGAIFSLAVAIQLSARIALLRRAKARYICFEIPRFRVPNSEPGISARRGRRATVGSQGGMEPRSCLYKSVPMQIVYLFIMEQFLRWQTAAQLPAPPLQLLFWRRSSPRVPA